MNAPHTLIVYSDFLCPWCKTLADIVDKKQKDYPGRFRVVFRNFPMDTMCNPGISQNLHPGGMRGGRDRGGRPPSWPVRRHSGRRMMPCSTIRRASGRGPQKFVRSFALTYRG